VDLRYVLRALGYKGGLKAIERTLGMSRPGEVASFDGWDAVRLWREYRAGSKEALRLLVEYNLEDVLNLEPLLRLAVNENIRRLGMPADAAPAGCGADAGEIIAGVVKGL
jgi:hypothetical protein